MAEDPRQWLYDKIGPPPMSPQQYTAENPGQEPPHELFKAWRTWNQREQEEVERAAEQSGESDPNKILETLGYRNEPDQGKSMFSRYGSGGEKKGVLETKSKDAFSLAVQRGHFTFDPKTKKYYNKGTGDPNDPRTWQWVDEGGKGISPPMGGSAQGFGSGWGYQRNQSGRVSAAGYGNLGSQQQSTGEYGGMSTSGPPEGYLPEIPGGPPANNGGNSGGVPGYITSYQMPNMQQSGMNQGGGGNGPQPNVQQQRAQDQQNQQSQENSPYKQLLGGRNTQNPRPNTFGAF